MANKLNQVLERIQNDSEIKNLWIVQNINSIDRLKINDHGTTHIKIVMENGTILMDCVKKLGLKTSLVENFSENKFIEKFNFDFEDSEIVVQVALALHDIGMCVHRIEHARFSNLLAPKIIERLLSDLYDERHFVVMRSEIMHAIACHGGEYKPFTLEGEIVRLSDALDLSKGRSKIPIRLGRVDIHAVAARGIEKVELKFNKKSKRPITIFIHMSDYAGMLQAKHIFDDDVKGSRLEDFIKIEIDLKREKRTEEMMTFDEKQGFRLVENGK